MTEQIIFTVPLKYKVPDSIKRLSPEVLCSVFDCMGFFISKLNINFEDYDLQSKHQDEMNTIISQFMKRLNDQKLQLLDERTEAINIIKTKCQEELIVSKKRHHDECKEEFKKLQSECASEKKKLMEEYDEQLRICKKRITEENSERINNLSRELEISHKAFKSQHDTYLNEQKMMHGLYETNLRDKDAMLNTFTSRIDDLVSVFHSFKSSSVSKGQFGENYMRTILQQQFPTAEIQDTSHTPHSGDTLVKIDELVVMIEMKTKNHITREDIAKFEYDINLHKNEYHGALFLSTSHGVPNKGEFLFEFIGDVPVIYVSKFIDSPVLLHLSLSMLFNLIPVFQHFRTNNEEFSEHDNLLQTLSSVVATVTHLFENLRQNSQTLVVIAQNILEQKKKNEEKLQWCINEIARLTENYKLKVKNTVRTPPSVSELFEILYTERCKIDGKYVYKNLIKNIVDKKMTKHFYTYEQILRILPKSKFEELCNQIIS